MEIRSELSQMSIEEILRLKEEIGSKIYNQAMGITKPSSSLLNQKNARPRKGIQIWGIVLKCEGMYQQHIQFLCALLINFPPHQPLG